MISPNSRHREPMLTAAIRPTAGRRRVRAAPSRSNSLRKVDEVQKDFNNAPGPGPSWPRGPQFFVRHHRHRRPADQIGGDRAVRPRPNTTPPGERRRCPDGEWDSIYAAPFARTLAPGCHARHEKGGSRSDRYPTSTCAASTAYGRGRAGAEPTQRRQPASTTMPRAE